MAAPHQLGLSPALDAAMRAQFENQAAFQAAMPSAPSAAAGVGALPQFGAPGMPPLPAAPQGLQGLAGLTGLPPLPADLQAKLGALQAGAAGAPQANSTFNALFSQPPGGAALPPGFPGLPVVQTAPSLPGGLLGQGGPPGLPRPNDAISAEAARAAAAQTAQHNKRMKEQMLKEQAAQKAEADKKKCHLHSKFNKKCKFCQRHEEFVKGQGIISDGTAESSMKGSRGQGIDDLADRRGALELVNSKTFGFSPLLQTHIVESAHLKALITIETVDELVNEMYQFADNIEPYMANSSTTPSALFCCIYRLFTMAIDARQLKKLVDNTDNPYVRCAGFLFIRFGLPSDQLWPWLGEYVLDDEELRPAKDSEWFTTIGEFVEGLLSQDKYYSTVLPRLPMSTKRQLEAKLAPIVQYRKRTKANLDLLDIYRLEYVKVEGNINGDWISGMTLELIDDAPSRLKVRMKLEDGTEETVHLGKVILVDRRYAGYAGTRNSKNRSRSKSRDRTDWARDKGRPDKDLITELRSKDREKAVCSSGKEYARKPLGYKASCALPREQGTASTRLMEEETFVPMKQMRRRSPSPATQEQEFRKAPSAEHQARMQALFEKYGMSGRADQGGGAARGDVETPDVMRLG